LGQKGELFVVLRECPFVKRILVDRKMKYSIGLSLIYGYPYTEGGKKR
jgi:hypothetical protein